MSTLPPGMKAFKVIRPFDHVAAEREADKAERAAAKEAKRKAQSDALDAHFTKGKRKTADPYEVVDYDGFVPSDYFPKGTKFTTSDDKVRDDEVVYQRKFDSSKGVKDKYTVRVRRDGSMSCNCMGWSVKKSTHRTCPHCDELINDLRVQMRMANK